MGGLETSRRALLAGAASAALWPGRLRAQPAARPPAYGWDPALRAPETADVVVAPDGDDAAPGTVAAPLRSVAAGVAALARRGGGSLALRGGTYREAVSLDALRGRPDAPFRIHRWGAERVTISALEPLDGWAPLDPAAAAAMGLPAGRIWRTEVARAALPASEGPGLNLFERGAWCPLATWRADPSEPARLGDPATYWPADYAVADGEERVLELADRRLAALPDAHLAGARLLLWHRPNLVSRMQVAGRGVGGAGSLRLAEPGPKVQKRGGADVTRYALENLPEGMAEGHWMAGPGSDAAVLEVLYWPRDPAGPAGMECAARDHCLDLGRAAHLELLGLEAVGAAGSGRWTGAAIRRRPSEDGGAGLAIRHCRAADVLALDRRGDGAIALADCTGLTVENVTVEDARNTFGLFALRGRDVLVRELHVRRVTNSAARFYTLREGVLAYCLFEEGGDDAHANQFNFYEGSDLILVHGLRTRRVGGFATYQEASRIHFAFCDLQIHPAQWGRALVAQNKRPGVGQGGPDGSGEPVAGGTFVYWNNCLQPERIEPGPANSLVLGPAESSQRHALFNNLLHGGGVEPVYTKDADPAMEARSHNVYTGLHHWQAPRHGWALGPQEATGGPALAAGLRGRDMRDVIAALAPAFPRFDDWDRDVDGTPVDWNAAPIGCRVG